MKLQLFYKTSAEQDHGLEAAVILDKGYKFEGYYVDDHRAEYDHEDDSNHPKHHGGSCFCDLPDYTDPVWPKLYNNYEYVASGWEAIQAVDLSTLK